VRTRDTGGEVCPRAATEATDFEAGR
jgi:hypothetical protein